MNCNYLMSSAVVEPYIQVVMSQSSVDLLLERLGTNSFDVILYFNQGLTNYSISINNISSGFDLMYKTNEIDVPFGASYSFSIGIYSDGVLSLLTSNNIELNLLDNVGHTFEINYIEN